MPFDYLQPDQNQTFSEAMKPRAKEAHVQGLTKRVKMLKRLGYSRDDALRRLEQNVEWDFGKWAKDLPGFYKELPAIVDKVYRR